MISDLAEQVKPGVTARERRTGRSGLGSFTSEKLLAFLDSVFSERFVRIMEIYANLIVSKYATLCQSGLEAQGDHDLRCRSARHRRLQRQADLEILRQRQRAKRKQVATEPSMEGGSQVRLPIRCFALEG